VAEGVGVTRLPRWLRPKFEDSTPRADLERIAALEADESPEAVKYKGWLEEVQAALVPGEAPKVTAQRIEARLEEEKARLEVEREASVTNGLRMGYRVPVAKIARIDAKLDLLNEKLDLLWAFLHPALVNGQAREYEEALGLKCRWPSCSTRISRDESFESGGSCAAHRDVELQRAEPFDLDPGEAFIRKLVGRPKTTEGM
jgi:hypothetical protein